MWKWSMHYPWTLCLQPRLDRTYLHNRWVLSTVWWSSGCWCWPYLIPKPNQVIFHNFRHWNSVCVMYIDCRLAIHWTALWIYKYFSLPHSAWEGLHWPKKTIMIIHYYHDLYIHACLLHHIQKLMSVQNTMEAVNTTVQTRGAVTFVHAMMALFWVKTIRTVKVGCYAQSYLVSM